MQDVERLAEVAPVDEVVPLRDDVVDGAAALAERDAAIHAAGALLADGGVGHGEGELLVALDALGHGQVAGLLPGELQEAGRLTHGAPLAAPGRRLSVAPPSRRGDARRGLELAERAAVLVGHHLDELAAVLAEAVEDAPGARAARVEEVALDEAAEDLRVGDAEVAGGAGLRALLEHGLEGDHGSVAAQLEVAGGVEHVGDAAAHAGGEVAARLAEHHHGAAGHVLAAVVAAALDDGGRAGVAHGEALAGHAAEEDLAADGAVEHGVADDDVLLRRDGALARRVDDDAAAREALADVVVGLRPPAPA